MLNKEIETPLSLEFGEKRIAPELEAQKIGVGVLILAGGKGSRLKKSDDPDLQTLPKPLVPIDSGDGRLPMLDNALYGIFATGIKDVVLLTSSDPEAQGSLIEDHTTANHQNTVRFIREEQPLGTAGAVFNALNLSEYSTVAIVPADTLFPFSLLPQILENHKAQDTSITWVVTTSPGENAQNSGRILVDPLSRNVVHTFENNPNIDISLFSDGLIPSTSVGVVIANREFYLLTYQKFLQECGDLRVVDMYRQFIPWLIDKGVQVGTFDIGQPAPDLGTPERLRQFGRKD